MFTFQKFDKVPGVGCDEIWVNSAEFIHHIHTITVDILVVVPHVFGDLADARYIFTRSKVTRQIKVGRSIAAGLQIAKAE
jgi:hypothetical protein